MGLRKTRWSCIEMGKLRLSGGWKAVWSSRAGMTIDLELFMAVESYEWCGYRIPLLGKQTSVGYPTKTFLWQIESRREPIDICPSPPHWGGSCVGAWPWTGQKFELHCHRQTTGISIINANKRHLPKAATNWLEAAQWCKISWFRSTIRSPLKYI